jgi:hypothetical protein
LIAIRESCPVAILRFRAIPPYWRLFYRHPLCEVWDEPKTQSSFQGHVKPPYARARAGWRASNDGVSSTSNGTTVFIAENQFGLLFQLVMQGAIRGELNPRSRLFQPGAIRGSTRPADGQNRGLILSTRGGAGFS